MNKQRIKIIGLYLLIILAIVRFLVVPLNNSIEAKKAIFNDYIETYKTKALLVKRQKDEQVAKKASFTKAEEDLLKSVYQKDSPYTSIQSETLRGIIKGAEKYGMTVLNFELPEASVTKNISEVPVLIRLKGEPKALVSFLKDLEKWKKAVTYKNFEVTKSGQEFLFTMAVSALRMEI